MSADARTSGPTIWPVALAVATVSAAALAYQLLLMRWLAIAHWQPFAVTIISLALLGHGASGTALCLWLARRRPSWLSSWFEAAFAACALVFSLTAMLALIVAAKSPFNGLELAWDPHQIVWLSALYLTLSVPFFFAACCFGLAFMRHGASIPLLYGADLAGAGFGALAALALSYLPPGKALAIVAVAAALAACIVPLHGRATLLRLGAAIAVAVLAMVWSPALAPPPNPFKALSRTLLLPQAKVIAQRDSPYGQTAVVASPAVPLRIAPGLSLVHAEPLPSQLGVFIDGDGPSVIVEARNRRGWLSAMTSALPYRVCRPRRVLVLGAGGGVDVLQALALGAHHVDAVDMDPQRLDLVRGFSGGVYRDARVSMRAADPRAFVRASAQRYDLIVLADVAAFTANAGGAQSIAEQYAATVEAMRDYLSRLTPRGCIAITRWSRAPAREELRLLSTAATALAQDRRQPAAARIIALRNWDASTWLIARHAFSVGEVAAARAFAEQWGLDTVHLPGTAAPAEKLHALDPPTLYIATEALLSRHARAYQRAYPFAIAPATDDRPYAGHYFRWRSLPETLRLRGQGSAVLLDSGYLLLIAALVQALPLSMLLVLWPLRALPGGAGSDGTPFPRTRAGLYFLALGLAFLMIEIATLSRLTLLVGHPLLAAGVGLAAFLLFAGSGSLQAQRWMSRTASVDDAMLVRRVRWAVRAIALGLVWQLAVFAATMAVGAGWPVAWRALSGLLGIAPLAFAMGQPFALGLARLARSAPQFVPWAWGLNGCASVVAALLALLWALSLGLRATLLCALALYAFAGWVWPGRVAPVNAP